MDGNGCGAPARLEIRLLGDLEVHLAGHDVTPAAPKLRQVLALLGVRCGHVVHADTLIDELWGGRAPPRAHPALHTHLYELRRRLGTGLVRTRQQGYSLDIPREQVDVAEFDTAIADGAALLAQHDPAAARERLAAALALSRGRVLGNVPCGDVLAGQVARLEETRLRAIDLRLEADLCLDRHREILAELKALVTEHPYHEGLWEKLLVALQRSGRRTEALRAYHELRGRLVDELGVEPGTDLQRAHHALVGLEPAPDPGQLRDGLAPRAAVGPSQVPRDLTEFTGRNKLLTASCDRLIADPAGETPPPVLAVSGMPGVGKTALAVHLAHRIRQRFPDGQLFAELGGSGSATVPAAEVTAGFLRACGMDSRHIPDDPAERVAAFRTWTADRAVLVVLDDADGAEQVRELIPSGPRTAAIVTSRRPVYGMPGTEMVALAPFDVDEGVELLGRLIGHERVAAEPAAAAEIVRFVGGLPLALASLGQRLAVHRSIALHAMRDTLAGMPLHGLSRFGPDLCGPLHLGYRRLSRGDRRTVRRLAPLCGTAFTAEQASRALGVDSQAAELAMMRLADVGVIQVAGAETSGMPRYSMHRVIQAFVVECLAAADIQAGQRREP